MTSAAPQTPALCPRCGYDQRGAMATWQDRCPLAGTCSECGLSFSWANLLHPEKYEPMWCVEYARGWRGAAASAVKTAGYQVVPWLFWRRVGMHHEPRFRRIVLYLCLLTLLMVYPALMVRQGIAAWRTYHQPAWFVAPPPAPPPPPPPLRRISRWHAVAWSALLPFSSQSPGWYMLGGAMWHGFPSPVEILAETWLDRYGWHNRYDGVKRFALLSLFWLTLLLLMPLSFMLLPQTRRVCKVRWSHVIRIALYAAAFTAPLLAWAAIWQVPHLGLLVMLLMCGINLVWWGCACSSYLHLPRPWFVASLLTTMLLLAGIAVQYHFVHEMFIKQILRWG